MPKPPAPPPEARLLKLARLRRHSTSITEAAELAGVSVSLWRQVETGYSTPAAGVHVPKVAPADTLAVMSRPLGITPAELAKAGREDAAAILAELQRPEPAPEPTTPDSGDDAAGAVVAGNVSTAVIRAAVPATVRAIWTRVRRELAPELFADAGQARAWPPGSAPLEVTPEVETILDAMRDTLFPGQVENAASRLVKYTWPERIMVAAASLDVLGQRPTVAVSRAG